MEATKSTNKKFIIALVAMAVAFLAVLGTLIGVFAAGNQTVNTNFNVTYKATNVAATVSASYQRATDAEAISMGSIKFTPTETTGEGLSAGESAIALATDCQTIEFVYTFKNDSTSVPYTVDLANGATEKNVNVTYKAAKDSASAETATASLAQFTVGVEETWEVIISVSIKDIASDATYASSSTAGLVWTLTSAVEA